MHRKTEPVNVALTFNSLRRLRVDSSLVITSIDEDFSTISSEWCTDYKTDYSKIFGSIENPRIILTIRSSRPSLSTSSHLTLYPKLREVSEGFDKMIERLNLFGSALPISTNTRPRLYIDAVLNPGEPITMSSKLSNSGCPFESVKVFKIFKSDYYILNYPLKA